MKYFTLILTGLIILFSIETHATHIMAADISYECLGDNLYRIDLNVFRDCGGAEVASSVVIQYSSSCFGLGTLILERDTTIAPNEVTQLCSNEPSNCTDGTFQGIEQYEFTALVSLAPCSDWKISYSKCCRNGAITNTDMDPISLDSQVIAIIDNSGGSCNNSPKFSALPVPYICLSDTTLYSHSVYDLEGDSLAFSLINPLSNDIPILFGPGFSATNPIGTAVPGGFELNSETGQITIIPDAIENSIFTILVEQFSATGDFLGSIRRDMQVIIFDCGNQNPQIDSVFLTNDQGIIETINDFELSASSCGLIQFEFTASDLDMTDSLIIRSNLDQIAASSSISCSGYNPTFCSVEASFSEAGQYFFTIEVDDDNCPIPAIQYYNFIANIDSSLIMTQLTSLQDTVFSGDTAFFQIDIINSGSSDIYDISLDDITGWSANCSETFFDDGTVLSPGDTLLYICYYIPIDSAEENYYEAQSIDIQANSVQCGSVAANISESYLFIPMDTSCTDARVISSIASNANNVYSTDLDGDGDMDVLSASAGDDKIAWYENDGFGNFSSEIIISTNADGALSVLASDLNGDGDMDILSASYWDGKIAWYENDGSGSFSNEIIITIDAEQVSSFFVADLDGDGDKDILSAQYFDPYHRIVWNENDGSENFSNEIFISAAILGQSDVYATDLDGDGDMDVLAGSGSENTVAWYENNGTGGFSSQNIIGTDAVGVRDVFASDLDGDGDLDILAACFSSDKITWYENLGSGNFNSEIVISGAADGARSVYASDLDGDGDTDVLSASLYDDKIAWYENDGLGNFSSTTIVTTLAYVATSVYASDLDSDGDIDILSSSSWDDRIAWYENNCGDPVVGCTDVNACNFESNASIDDGSCLYDDCIGECGGSAVVGSMCDDFNPITSPDYYDENCHCVGDTPSSIHSAYKDNFLSIYPIPASNIIYITIDKQVDAQLSIIDVFGKIIVEYSSLEREINISDLASGIYFLKAETTNRCAVKKFIKE